MNRLEKSLNEVKYLVDNHDYFCFPALMKELRLAHGITKKVMSDDLQMNYLRVHYLENGFGLKVKDDLLDVLSCYFGFPLKILKKKRDDYFLSNADKCKISWRGEF